MSATKYPIGEHLDSLERGLRVLALFGHRGQNEFTIIEVAEQLHYPRAVARRVLLTLERLGYVRCDGRRYSLTPRVLTLGYAYLASLGFRAVAQPILEALVTKTGQTCSIGVLDGVDVVYIARAESRRLVRIDLSIGSRLPAHLNSMGRVLLGSLPNATLDARLATIELAPLTRYTVRTRRELKRRILEARQQGWCYIAHEVEEGICGLAAPLRDRHGEVIAALNLGLAFTRHTEEELRRYYIPLLLERTHAIEQIVQSEMLPSREPAMTTPALSFDHSAMRPS